MRRAIVIVGVLATGCVGPPRNRTAVEGDVSPRSDAGMPGGAGTDDATLDAALPDAPTPDAAPPLPPRPGPCEVWEDGGQTIYGYDATDHLISEAGNGAVTTYDWDAEGRLRRMSLTSARGSPCDETVERTLEYEEDRLVEVRGYFGNCESEGALHYRYDESGRLVVIEGPDDDEVRRFAYDGEGRLVRETFSAGNGEDAEEIRRIEYEPAEDGWTFSWTFLGAEYTQARMTCEAGRVVELDGLWLSTRDLIETVRYSMEYAGERLAVIHGVDSTDDGPSGPYVWQFTYDALGDLVLADRHGGEFDRHREYIYDCFDGLRGPAVVRPVDHRYLDALPGALTRSAWFTLEALLSDCSPHWHD